MDAFGEKKYPHHYNPATGVVTFSPQRVKPGSIDAIPSSMDAHTEFFLRCNPGYLVPIRITRKRSKIGGMNRQETKNRERARERTPNNGTTTGFRISDELWAQLQPLLPVHVNTHRFGGGRPRVPDRDCADAIFYVLRTGCQWQALDQTELCAHSTAHDRFQEWVQAGVFLKLGQTGIVQFDELRCIDWQC